MVKQEASTGVPENLIRSDRAPADPGGSAAIGFARHEAPASFGHQRHQLSQKDMLNRSAATSSFCYSQQKALVFFGKQ